MTTNEIVEFITAILKKYPQLLTFCFLLIFFLYYSKGHSFKDFIFTLIETNQNTPTSEEKETNSPSNLSNIIENALQITQNLKEIDPTEKNYEERLWHKTRTLKRLLDTIDIEVFKTLTKWKADMISDSIGLVRKDIENKRYGPARKELLNILQEFSKE